MALKSTNIFKFIFYVQRKIDFFVKKILKENSWENKFELRFKIFEFYFKTHEKIEFVWADDRALLQLAK